MEDSELIGMRRWPAWLQLVMEGGEEKEGESLGREERRLAEVFCLEQGRVWRRGGERRGEEERGEERSRRRRRPRTQNAKRKTQTKERELYSEQLPEFCSSKRKTRVVESRVFLGARHLSRCAPAQRRRGGEGLLLTACRAASGLFR